MNITFNGIHYPCKVWTPDDGSIGVFALDTETTLIQNNETPDFIIGTVFNGRQVYFLKKDRLHDFFRHNLAHRTFMANAPFDLLVLEKVCDLSPTAIIDQGLIVDVLLLSQLVKIAESGESEFGSSLASVSKDLLRADLPKDLKDADGNDVRLTFSRFVTADGGIDYQSMPMVYLQYAGTDAIATYLVAQDLLNGISQICKRHNLDEKLLLSHHIQLKAAYALHLVSQLGLHIDQDYKQKIQSEIKSEIKRNLITLKQLGWTPGAGSNSTLQTLLQAIEMEFDICLPRTPNGKISAKTKYLQDYAEIPFFNHLIRYKNNSKLLEFLKFDGQRIHARFNSIVSTGRTSSFGPNIQNFPRDSRIRSIIAPSPGYVFLDVDYSQIELCSLAQITYQKFGHSKMRDLLNSEVDLHTFFASVLTGHSGGDIGKDSEDRRKAKACNFGFPGGLGIQSFIEYAKANYDVLLSEEEAMSYREKWLDTFPEVRNYLEYDEQALLKSSGVLQDFEYSVGGTANEDAMAWIFRGIISGNKMTRTSQRPYTEEEVEGAFAALSKADFYGKEEYINSILLKRGSKNLWDTFIRSFNTIVMQSGRIRSNVTYCQLKNNPFQGLAADGAKEALYNLTKQKYRVVNFIHDEFLIEIPEDDNFMKIETDVTEILVSSMSKYCPDIKIKVDAKWMRRWSKGSAIEIDEHGVDGNGLSEGRAGAFLPMQFDGKEVQP